MAKKEKLFLLDGTALAYRAYYAFIGRPLVTSGGMNVSAVYGFTNSLIKILEEEKPDYIAVVFDSSQPTFRHEMHPEYKATREKMPEDMAIQLQKLKEVIEAFNIPILEIPGYEADDVMGTIAKIAESKGIETYLVTGDKDFLQLVSPMIKIYRPTKGLADIEIVDVDKVKQEWGVTPEQIVDVLGLMGDKVDNVPGVPGIGEKTAVQLIKEFGSIENLIKNVDRIPTQKIKENLKSSIEKALLSKTLVTIKTDVPLDINIYSLKASQPNREKLAELFYELEFKSLIKKLGLTSAVREVEEEKIEEQKKPVKYSSIKTEPHQYHIIKSIDELKDLVDKLKSADLVSFDTESTGIEPLNADLIGISFAVKPGEAFYVPVSVETTSSDSLFELEKKKKTHGIEIETVLKYVKPILEDPGIKKCGQNLKYDMLLMAKYGVWISGISFDTMVAGYILNPEGSHTLEALAKEYLKYQVIPISQLIGEGRFQRKMSEVPVEKVAEYACEDADVTLKLVDKLKNELERREQLKLCEEVEFPLVEVLAHMEFSGVKLDTDLLREMSKELDRMLDNLTHDIYRLAGTEFNINSPQQLADVLFKKLKLPPVKTTKTGYSTDVEVLEELAKEHPIAEKLLEYRQIQKLKSTYVDALPKLVNPKTGKVHTSFNQTGTATGRLSSSDPNLQNIPIRTEIGREIRKAFIPSEPDWFIMSADYSQIELRIMAHLSGDENLISAFRKGLDIHSSTAASVFGVRPEDVNYEMRRKAKEVNFGIMYGISPYGLSQRLGIPQPEAKKIIEVYFQRFPKVKEYIDKTIAEARQKGYVATLLGRRRYVPDINSRNRTVREFAERTAINMRIQGTAADLIKLAMVRIYDEMKKRKFKSKMILQVHDELVFDVAPDEVEQLKEIVLDKMQNALQLDVPLVVELGVGKNWYEAHE
ncbi:DNA polymerase I [Candidatus Kryptonium thompsonii]|uniref:DNA polymerase I n=2 Tax=Candidatus Kryptonium thompsonii TaxID=1633631 RepID=A0A0P1LU55_9BACT|nr:DNA polymerase I [Candidatus Kryptonium thompsoni]CUS83714.1 DNA polymerase I [Candidatus Kryptonium thompsoni]CUS84798.1 DNA polymerase I [Candidatus Kryptonium thompsoni]CUS85364.1 DNA polymerase I [Candidatus Kryptonium thompsoni]CUS87358.1 DNA polymerase I [Candidatus Kryptonium thompsoni]CUS89708.1 DNA polymerase I [Candidatus Kryptonium thompsoni]